MSSFSSSLQTMRGTTGSTSVSSSIPMENEAVDKSCLVLATEENEATKEAEVDGNVGDRVGAFLVG